MRRPSLVISLLLGAASLVLAAGPAQALLAQASTPAAQPGAPALPGRAGVVIVEQGGRAVALGTLLNGDGRVLTALSRLTRLNTGLPLFIRYEGGRLEAARVGSSDATRDLALLVPSTARVRVGVKASRSPQPLKHEPLHSFTLQPDRSLLPFQQTLGAQRGSGLTELGAPSKAGDAGGPLLTAGGEAVAILVGGCAGTQLQAACQSPPVALPVTEVRAFLRELPAAAALSVPWLGARGRAARPSDRGLVPGVLVIRIEPGSPAANAGVVAYAPDRSRGQTARSTRPDVIVAVSGEPTPNPDALRGALSSYAPGERIELLLFNGRYRVQPLRLAAPPGPKAKVPPRLLPSLEASPPSSTAPAPTPAAPAAAPVKSP